jgi:hypothetical protein
MEPAVPLESRAARRPTDARPPRPVVAVTDDVGDPWPAGLVELYEERRLQLVRLAYVLTSDREVAEEVVHDAVLALRP